MSLVVIASEIAGISRITVSRTYSVRVRISTRTLSFDDVARWRLVQHEDIAAAKMRINRRFLITLWQCNLQKSKAHRTRIILLDPPYVLKSLDGESFSAEVSRDEAQMHTIRNYILQKKNVLFYAGLGHVWSQIWSIYLPSYDYCYNYQSAGNLLKTAYPDQVFLIQLWGALMGRNGYIPTNDNRVWQPLYGGVIDKAFEVNGNSPVGFDVCEAPFDKVTVARFYTTPETYADYDKNSANGSTYTKTRLLSEQIDGIVFFKPIKEFSGATVSEEFFDDDFVTRI